MNQLNGSHPLIRAKFKGFRMPQEEKYIKTPAVTPGEYVVYVYRHHMSGKWNAEIHGVTKPVARACKTAAHAQALVEQYFVELVEGWREITMEERTSV